MILQELARYYETLGRQEKVSRQGWCKAKAAYALELDTQGNLIGILTREKMPEKRGKKEVMVPSLLEVPQMLTRSSGIAANFLCDNSKYLLGISAQGADPASQLRFEAAKEKHLRILKNAESTAALAVKRFFQRWEPERAKEIPEIVEKWDEVTGGENLVFRVAHQYAQQDEAVRTAWQHACQTDAGKQSLCLVTGKPDEIARTHSAIKGVQGAQSSGAMLVSFNAPAFESYGKEQSYNAPVGQHAMFAYTTALNYLLSQRDYVFTLGDTTVVFWAESGEEKYQKTFLDFLYPQIDNQKEIKRFFENLAAGRALDLQEMQLNPEQRFSILGLSPNAARLSARFFYQDTFGAILKNLHRHYNETEIVRPAWDERSYLGIWSLLFETVNQKSKDKKPQASLTAALFKAILSGARYPENLYGNTLIRIRAEQGAITRGRAAIIRAYLIRNKGKEWIKEGKFVALNEECNDIAYILGREFAVLEAIQEEANPGINATIKDRYFNAACATPGIVFPTLMKLKESHIRKIDKKKKYFERILTQLQGKIEITEGNSPYPKRFSLEDQGKFILGYYHQVQKRFEKKEDKQNEGND